MLRIWEAVKNFFKSKVKPVTTKLPTSLAKITCDHEYVHKKQAWIRTPSKAKARVSFKLVHHKVCTKCSQDHYVDASK